jgi:hypothetical protein
VQETKTLKRPIASWPEEPGKGGPLGAGDYREVPESGELEKNTF